MLAGWKTLARFLAALAALIAGSAFLDWRAITPFFGFFAKVMAGALMPFAVVLGGLATLLGLLRRDRASTVVGSLASGLALYYLVLMSRRHDQFERVFGVGWQANIPAEGQKLWLPERYVGRLPQVPTPQVERDVIFARVPGTARDLRCDVWQAPPDVVPSGLALIFFHGSGWRYGDKDEGTAPSFRHLAAQGHLMVDVSYRLVPETDLAGMVGDVKRAIQWLKRHAERYRIDPDKIVLGGASAGAHLALLAAYAPHHPELTPEDITEDVRVAGVVDFYGPTDLIGQYDTSRAIWGDGWLEATPIERLLRQVPLLQKPFMVPLTKMVTDFIGGNPMEMPERYALASPLTHVDGACPPTLILHGRDDSWVGIENARALHRALRGARVPVLLVEIPYTEHAFDLILPAISPPAQVALYDVERFLALLAQKD